MFDESTRVICMTNMINLIKATGGKNLILSSSAKSIYTQRTPYDSAALLASIGLNKNQALATMKQNP
jgi:RNase P/RNase MRP subunit p30